MTRDFALIQTFQEFQMDTKTACLRLASLLGATAGCLLLAGNVCAGDKVVTESYRIDTRGLDPARPADAHTLYTRLGNAAWFVCMQGMRADLVPLRGEERTRCYEKALGDAVRTTNKPLVTQIYLGTHTLQEVAAHGIKLPEQVAAK
jgi:UrcA family protein